MRNHAHDIKVEDGNAHETGPLVRMILDRADELFQYSVVDGQPHVSLRTCRLDRLPVRSGMFSVEVVSHHEDEWEGHATSFRVLLVVSKHTGLLILSDQRNFEVDADGDAIT